MFGYHDSPTCSFDLWSPNPTRWGDNAIENRAFSPFCKHTQEILDVVEMICAGADASSIELDDDFSENDLAEIDRLLRERGINVTLSLD